MNHIIIYAALLRTKHRQFSRMLIVTYKYIIMCYLFTSEFV